MKVKNVKRFVKCDVCEVQKEDQSSRGCSHSGHTMIVVSMWDSFTEKRQYYDICSLKCLAVFSDKKNKELAVACFEEQLPKD